MTSFINDQSSENLGIMIFVYGTLRNGGSNHWRMENASFYSNATVCGKLYCVDWYPGLVLDPESNVVVGEIYFCDDSLLRQLDDFEGDYEYQRKLVKCVLPNYQITNAYAWVYKRDTSNLKCISSGDWLAHESRTKE